MVKFKLEAMSEVSYLMRLSDDIVTGILVLFCIISMVLASDVH